ncbi:MAG: hypothetical protein ABDH21_01990 [bacterium]
MIKLILFLLLCLGFINYLCFSQDYILTDVGRGVEKIEVDILTREPVYLQQASLDIKVYLIKFKKDLPVAAGMSGSPLFSNGKILGALFAAFPFQKQPLALVIPIEYMHKIKAEQLNFSTSLITSKTNYSLPLIISLPNQNISTLLNQEFKNLFGKNLITTIPSVVDNQKNDEESSKSFQKLPIKEGSSISIALVDGDIKLFVTGTLTYLDKEGYFLGFGHEMFNLGKIEAPVYISKVITVVDRYDDSFILSSITNQKIGSLVFDTKYGIMGKLSKEPKMIPMNIRVLNRGKLIKDYSCYVVNNNKILYLLSLITLYSGVSGYVQADIPYELLIEIGFSNGRVQKISIPSINTPIDQILLNLNEYFKYLSSFVSSDNNVRFISFVINIEPQELGIINNISISNRDDNNIVFNINYFDPILKRPKTESVKVVFPTEAANEDIYFGVGGEYDIPRIFEELGISWTLPKDFNQFITFVNFFSQPNPKSLSVVISTKLYGAISYNGGIIPLTTPQFYKYYLQYTLPFIYLSYYPIIIKQKTNFIPLGYDIFQINVSGSISKVEKQDKAKPTYVSFLNSIIRNINSNSDSVQEELYEMMREYNYEQDKNNIDNDTNNDSQLQESEDSEKKEKDEISSTVNLSKYEDLVDGIQNNVLIDYQSNITFSKNHIRSIKISKSFFKVLYYYNNLYDSVFLGLCYEFDNSTVIHLIDKDGNIKYSKKFEGIFSDARISSNKMIVSTYDGRIILIDPKNLSIQSEIKTHYIFNNVDFYQNSIVALNIKYPCSVVFVSTNGKIIRERILPFINLSNLIVNKEDIFVACYGGVVLRMNPKSETYYQTYQENVTALEIVDDNILIGTYPKPFVYVIPNYTTNSGFTRPILYDGFDMSGYIEDIKHLNDKILVSYKGNRLAVFLINKSELIGQINQLSQQTLNLNWYKIFSPLSFYWFIPFSKDNEKIYISLISNTFTVINHVNFADSNKGDNSYGEYISKVFDSGQYKYLYDIIVKASGKYDIFIRLGNNPIVDQSWTSWINYKDFRNNNYRYRYFQYKLLVYPETIVYRVIGLLEKINYKPFFILNLDRKVLNSSDSISVSVWDPNGDKLNLYLEYYEKGKWNILDQKQVETNTTDLNEPDFSKVTSLNINSQIMTNGKYTFRVRIDDKPLNPSNYFTQSQVFELFIDNNKPRIKNYVYNNGFLVVEIEDENFVEAFIEIGDYKVPLRLDSLSKSKSNTGIYRYCIRIELDKQQEIHISARDEASNNERVKINL